MNRRKLYGIAGAILTLVIPLFMMFTDPYIETSQSICPIKMATGFPCPGCGITKSIIFLYKGDIPKSMSYHALGIPVVLFCIAIIIMFSLEIFNQSTYFRKILYSQKLAYTMAFLLAGYHIVRLFLFVKTHTFHEILVESIWQ